MVQVKLFEGWGFENEVNMWLAEHQKSIEVVDVKIQFVGSESESYPYALVIYKRWVNNRHKQKKDIDVRSEENENWR